MTHDEIIQYYDSLMRLAVSKCGTQTDAEDLVGDTMLAAFACMQRGGIIEHPKTWLTNTLCHKHNDTLRKKYRSPVTVCLDESIDIAQEEEDEYLSSEDAAKVRGELNHLGQITREVLIRYYFGNRSVADIAKELCIPEGTVKSRLSAGRSQMKKGLESMETRENYLPGQLHISFGGSEGRKGEPVSLVENDRIVQNLLILAYEKPLTVSELSRAIGIPAAYIEPILEKLVDGELMVQTDSGKVYTDFIITKPQDTLQNFQPQLAFAHRHFPVIWDILEKMSARIAQMPFTADLTDEEKIKLDRYAVLKALQDFQHYGSRRASPPEFPLRRDGGRWIAQGVAYDAGYNSAEYRRSLEYCIHGGHRTSEARDIGRTKRIRFYEFDTTLWDSPARYGGAYELYFRHIIPLLWSVHEGIPLDASDIPNEFIAYMPTLEKFGLITSRDGHPRTAIPVLEKAAYEELCSTVHDATEEISSAVGEEYAAFTASMKTPLPRHLTSVPDLFRFRSASTYFVMAIVREAYEKEQHLKNVNFCCPPAVLVYEK